MACERYREALADAAAGAAPRWDLEAHLAVCTACRADLDGLRRALGAADAEMASLLAADASPALKARILRAVAEDGGPTERPWRSIWLWGTAAAATLLVALAVVMGRGGPRGPRPTPDEATATRAARPGNDHREARGAQPAPAASPATPGRPTQDGPHVSRPSPRARGTFTPEPDVLVPLGEEEALLRLASDLMRRGVPPDSLLVADSSAPLAEPKPIEIEPLDIVPLDPAETPGTD